MKISVLIENSATTGYKCEHGLSFLCEYHDKMILLDAGSSDQFADNAELLGISLLDVNFAVLSHSHYDHSNGFPLFLRKNETSPLYIRKEALGSCYANEEGHLRYIGIPRTLVENLNERIKITTSKQKLVNGVWIIPHIASGYPQRGERSKMKWQGKGDLISDNFLHEQTLVFEDGDELVICSCCSHAGADNIIKEVKLALPGKTIKAFVGGLHLMGSGPDTLSFSEEEVKRLGYFLRDNISSVIYTGHCTGTPAFEILSTVIGDKLKKLSSGLVIEL